eukprot:s1314_g4.t1
MCLENAKKVQLLPARCQWIRAVALFRTCVESRSGTTDDWAARNTCIEFFESLLSLSNRYRNVVPLPNGTNGTRRTPDGVSGPHPVGAEKGSACGASIRHLNGNARASWSSSAEAQIPPGFGQSPLLTAHAQPTRQRATSKDEWQMEAQDGRSQASASEVPISADADPPEQKVHGPPQPARTLPADFLLGRSKNNEDPTWRTVWDPWEKGRQVCRLSAAGQKPVLAGEIAEAEQRALRMAREVIDEMRSPLSKAREPAVADEPPTKPRFRFFEE